MCCVFVSLAALSVVSASLVASTPPSSIQSRTNNAFLDCLNTSGLAPVVPGASLYANDSAPFNLRLPWRPAALVYPNNSTQVSAAVKCAAANGVKVNARGGGHSYAAFALGGEGGHLTISLDNLRNITVDGENATIGGGSHLGDVALYLWNHGKRALAHGTCPYVGIGGHAGQGGFGLPSRMWGLLSDQVQSIEIVTGNGTIATTSNSNNTDLFWAAMGAGSSFGIITSFTVVTHEAVNSTVFTYTFSNYNATQASKGLQAWQNFGNDAANPVVPELGLQLFVNPGSVPKSVNFSVRGVYYTANAAKLNSTMAPLLEQLGQPNWTFIQEKDWISTVLYLADANYTSPDDLNTTHAPDVHDYFYATSTVVAQNGTLGANATDVFMNYLYGPGKTSHVQWFTIFDLYGSGQSRITSLPSNYSAFNARDAQYSIQYYGTIPSGVCDADGIKFIQGMKAAIEASQPLTVFKEYVNYIDSTYSADAAHKKYYPSHTDRLTQLKDKYDPLRVIHHPQDF